MGIRRGRNQCALDPASGGAAGPYMAERPNGMSRPIIAWRPCGWVLAPRDGAPGAILIIRFRPKDAPPSRGHTIQRGITMTDASRRPLTRRRFINLVGKAGGVSAAYSTMAAMGLLPVPNAQAAAPPLAPARGERVIILGAGLAGMTAAYELGKAGYQCVILEARERPGGRSWTLRGGDRVEETDSAQTVTWDRADHLYFNPGPARIPQHHTAILGYCREFGVPLEVFVNDNRDGLMQDAADFAGKPVKVRQVRGDTNGHISELLAKAVNKGALDEALDAADKEKLIAFLRAYGGLREDLTYHGSQKAGFAVPPGAGKNFPKLNEPLALKNLIRVPFWQLASNF